MKNSFEQIILHLLHLLTRLQSYESLKQLLALLRKVNWIKITLLIFLIHFPCISLNLMIFPPLIDFKIFVVVWATCGFLLFTCTALPITDADMFIPSCLSPFENFSHSTSKTITTNMRCLRVNVNCFWQSAFSVWTIIMYFQYISFVIQTTPWLSDLFFKYMISSTFVFLTVVGLHSKLD